MNEEILHIGFNQDCSSFIYTTESGFYVCSCDPIKKLIQRKFTGGIGNAEMYNNTSLFALVGGGKNPYFSSNKVILWDDAKQKPVGELCYKSSVKNVKMKKDKLLVVLANKIHMYEIKTLTPIIQMETCDNLQGVCALCPDTNKTIIAYPGKKIGEVKIDFIDDKKSTTIEAHKAPIANISINRDGTKIATASERGTLIRVFDTEIGKIICELRRGLNAAAISSICFSCHSEWLAVASNRGTVHVFSLTNPALNSKSTIANIGGVISDTLTKNILPSYFLSEWSFAQFTVPDDKIIAVFDVYDSLIIISNNGNYFRATYDPTVKRFTKECRGSYL